MNRRTFVQSVSAAAASGLLPAKGLAQIAPAPERPIGAFPPGFLWGMATAAFQMKGAYKEDGKGESTH